MILQCKLENEFKDLPLAEKQFYKPVLQWYGLSMWHSLDADYEDTFKKQFPNHTYRKIYIPKNYQ